MIEHIGREPSATCRMTVVVPAKNEEASIASALRAFGEQRTVTGAPLDRGLFEVLVYANDCSDRTLAVVADFAANNPELRIVSYGDRLPEDAAHVGTARRLALDLAFDRQRDARGCAGIIASTDADSRVDPQWVARTLEELRNVDAVAGYVFVNSAERELMPSPLRLMYDLECAYRRARGDVESRLDPRPYDPPRRHDSLVGTSFAVTTATYDAAGRLPPLPMMEDVAFARALRRIDARVRHSYDVRVETSGRLLARVDRGFAALLAGLHDYGVRRADFPVENARRTIVRARLRARLRTLWANSQWDDVGDVCEVYALTPKALREAVEPAAPFGETLERLEDMRPSFETLPDESIASAIATLERAAREPSGAATEGVRVYV